MHVMLDLETFGTGTKPALLQVGLVAFDLEKGPVDLDREWNITLQSCLLAGLDVDPQTVDWWKGQTPEARKSVCGAAFSLETVLGNVEEYLLEIDANLEEGGLEGLWSHGAASDIPWLAAAFEALGRTPPWSYRAPRCTRTLFWMARELGWEPTSEREGELHTAAADAANQARDVCSAFRAIRFAGPHND